ncbi:MAG: glycosyltransferase [Candidatus Omnitrophica bacterium]|nr:glycosyltransferase [Candidatus Omnitrophota bacterium]
MRGGEKCLEVFCEIFPQATVFTLLHNKGSVSPVIESMDIRTSFIQGMPGAARGYRNYLPLFSRAVESFDLSGYDLVLSSSHCVAKGARPRGKALHICYCYTPVRYAWKFFDQYFGDSGSLRRALISFAVKRLKKWDLSTNKRVDYFIAISDNVKNRIKDYYSRSSDVIYPPVKIPSESEVSPDDKGYYLVVSAMEPYKKVDLAVKAFNAIGEKLVIAGKGSRLEELRSSAAENIEFTGWVDDEALADLYKGCKALVFPGEEDFGIVPVEAQSYGKPVIAYGRGGARETVRAFDGKNDSGNATGVFFGEQTVDSLAGAVRVFEENGSVFDPVSIRRNSLRFDRKNFKRSIEDYIDSKLAEKGC